MIPSETFAELTNQDLALTPVSQRLHPLDKEELQFVVDDTEYLACHDLYPYGDITKEIGPEKPNSRYVLPLAEIHSDYTLFELPKDLLSLDRLLLGHWTKNLDEIKPVFKEAGRMVGELSRNYAIHDLGIKSLAMLRNNGQLVIVPPYHFKLGPEESTLAMRDLSKSIHRLLRHIMYGRKIADIIHSSEVGFYYGRDET
jgi:hypothetical protein